MKSTERYAYLWDGSQPGWVVLHTRGSCTSLTIRFAGQGPNLREVASIRAAVPEFGTMPPSDAFAALKGSNLVALGPFEGREARRIAKACRLHGLEVEETSESTSSYLPFNENTKSALLIEDSALSEQVCREAIVHGLQVREVEA